MFAGKGTRRRFLALAGAGVIPVCVQAAPPPPTPPPGTPTPGAVGDTLKTPPPLQAPTPLPSIQAPPQAVPAQGSGATLTVSRFVFSGNTVFRQDELAPLLADYLNHPITLAQLYEAADKVADFYTRKGYALASVNVPAQKIKDGTVRLEVIEGHIGKIGFEGRRWYREEVLREFAYRTKPKDIYKNGPLEQDLQALNALPGLAARAVIQPGGDYGSSEVTVKLQENPIDGYVVLDNYGRKDTGEYRVSASVTLNNPGRIGDQLTVLGTHATDNRLDYAYFDYNAPLNFHGTRLDVNFGHAYFNAAPINIPGKNNNLQVNLVQPLLRSNTDTVTVSGGFVHTDGEAEFAGTTVSNTNINLLSLSAAWSHGWADAAVTQYNLGVHTNFSQARSSGAFGNDTNRERLRLDMQMQHLQPLPLHLQVLAQVDAQYSPDPLADTEQFSIGGPTSVRGFPTSEARGDRGFYGQLTLRRPIDIGKVALVPRVYIDTGLVDSKNFAPTPNSSNSLTSAGLGADLVYRSFDLKVDWSYPLDSTPVSDGRDDGRVYASLTAGF
jgi:hemolysin activation/secretion protein